MEPNNFEDIIKQDSMLEKSNQPISERLSSNASYTLEYNEEGVFLIADYGTVDGKPLRPEIVIYDLTRRGITGFNDADIRLNIKRCNEKIRIADAQNENASDTDLIVFIAKDEMLAEMILLPPCKTGSIKGTEQIVDIIRQKWEVVFGVDVEAINKAVASLKYYNTIPIAYGKLPENGEDGHITFLFNTKHDYVPKITEDGSADYKNLNVFESVSEGATVAVKTPPTDGIEGNTVKGTKLAPKKGAEAKFPRIKNLHISEDGNSVIADKSGRIDYRNNRIEVTDVYKVLGDVDMSVGNIQFAGDIIISGNVISGLKIEAAGMIEVMGYVEASTLIAGKDIILRNGMQGMDKGKLVAGGNITARFIEHSEIEAKDSITSDYIVHCNVVAGEAITMQGKWGRILGGTVRAGKVITANTVGSPSNELTVIMLGASPTARVRYAELIESKAQIRAQLDKINSVAKVFSVQEVSPERQEMRDKLIAAKEQLENQFEEVNNEIELLNELLSKNSGARLHVLKTIYPNVKMTIDTSLTTIKNPVDFATFRSHEGEITFSACTKGSN